MRLEITLQPKQKEALKKSLVTPVLFYGGSKGGGKSYLVRAREIIRRSRHSQTKGLIVRKTYPELLSNHIRMFFREHPIIRSWYNKAEKTIYWPNGSTTEFSYLQNTDDVYTYQGREYEDISIDEITQHEEEVFKILRSSNRTTLKTIKPTMLLTGNPGGIGHSWCKRIFVDRDFVDKENPKDFDFLQAKVFDNKALMDADPDYLRRLEDLPEDKRRAYLEGDWDIFAGQVFSEFRRDKHVIKRLIPRKNFVHFLSFDWGYSAPFAAYAHAIIPMKTEGGEVFNRIVTYREWYGTEKPPREWAKIIYQDTKARTFGYGICDPSMLNPKSDGSSSIAGEMEVEWRQLNGGDSWVHVTGGTRNRIQRVAITHNWLSDGPDGRPYWQITENCTSLIRTLPMLVYDENKVEDVDTSQEDHGWDGATYGLNEVKFIDVKAGGLARPKPLPAVPIAYEIDEKGEKGMDLSAFENVKPRKPWTAI